MIDYVSKGQGVDAVHCCLRLSNIRTEYLVTFIGLSRVRFLTTPILPGRGHLVYPLIGSYGVYRTTTGQVKGYTELQVTLGVGTVVWEFRIILLSQ